MKRQGKAERIAFLDGPRTGFRIGGDTFHFGEGNGIVSRDRRNIRTFEGIIKDDPTGNATIEGETKVQAIGSTLHIYLPKAETISVYTLSGLLYEQQDVSAGSTQIHLSKGMYLVKIGEGTYKIVIR